jgi:hypothetical protein
MRRAASLSLVVLVAAGVLAVLGVAACSVLFDPVGLVGTARIDETDASDGAATSADGSSDAGKKAVSDAASFDAADASGYCASQTAAFCDDFDVADGGLFALWDQVHLNGGSLSVDDSTSVSPPSALLATEAASADGIRLTKSFPAHARTVLSADVLLETRDSVGYGSFLEIHLSPAPDGYSDYRAALIYTGGVMTLDAYSLSPAAGSFQNSVNLTSQFTSWTRVSLELSFTPTPHASAYDDTGALIGTVAMPTPVTTKGAEVDVGMPYLVSNTAMWRVHIDNVVVTLTD